MDPKPNDHSSAGADPDEFTDVRNRSRRVSFAETTAVHVFARDEDFETPDSKPSNEGSKVGDEQELGFQDGHLESGDSKGSSLEDEDEDGDDGEQEKFIRDMDSYSPGSTAGSVTSNDDNFFGPVSASFINSGRLSEAGMSEDNNHDITLDSTAFSLHFRNVVPPDDRSVNSAGYLRTPTGDLVPTNAIGFIPSNRFTHHDRQNTLSGGKMSSNAGDSSIVSLIGDDPDSYGRYGKLSPTLDALLTETNKSMQPDSPISGSGTRTPRHDEYMTAVAKESVKDESHVSSMDATCLADAACFDPNLSVGCPVGIEGDQNGSSISSPNKVLDLPIVAMINEKTQFSVDRTNKSPNSKMDGDKRMLDSISLKELLPSKLTEDNGLNGQDLQSVQKTYSSQTELSGKKRGFEQILSDEDHTSEASRAQKSPKVLTDIVGSYYGKYSGHGVEGSNESVSIGGQEPQKHWKEIDSKISEATTQLFFPSICKLNAEELDILEDILGELQSARKYERLLTSLRNHNSLGDHRQQRVAEARSLLDKLVYEKAKLQLKRCKLDKLSNKAQLCKSKLLECAKLKSIYSHLTVLDARNVQHGGSQFHFNSDNSAIDQVEYERVTSMRQKLEMLDQKVNHMMKAFETSCKIKGTTSCDGVIKVVNDHLEMKTRCKPIQQDLLMWKLSDVVKKNDQCDVVLNFCNILCQRFPTSCNPPFWFTIQSRSVLSIVASNILDNARIKKNFPNMNACLVFEFVFKAKGDRRFSSSKQFSRETLETNLLLGNILDVLEEVQVSRIQLWNLISSTFNLQCSGRLDLKLSFLSFKNGWKATLSLDLTILNCAGYPSNPSDFHIRIVETETTSPPSISDKIVNAVESLEVGRSMIARLCQSISNLVRDSDGS